jgi:ribosomal protein L11 methyltransferase
LIRDAAAAVGLPEPSFETCAVGDRDWVRETQAQFRPIRIRDNFWIVPSWCEPPRHDAINLVLDPGLAFGTGSHATTRLCLQWLALHVAPGMSVLDYGCGSGILAIAAALLGASPVAGTDVDPQALVASRANAQANDARAQFVHVDALDEARYARVVANILARSLCVLAPVLAARTNPGGRIALSGILVDQADEVVAAYARWFDVACWRTEDGWVLLDGQRRDAERAR